MIMNEVYTKDFEFKDTTGGFSRITIKPLQTKHLPKLFKIAGKFQSLEGKGKDGINVLEILDEKTTEDLIDLCVATIKRSLPSENQEVIEDFVSSHFLQLIPLIFEVNFKSGE